MPVYEYKCEKCEKVFDVSGTYEALMLLKPQCPDCKSKKVKKLIGKVNFILKGEGFYKTDSQQ